MDISIVLVEEKQANISKYIKECTDLISNMVDEIEFIVVSNNKMRKSTQYKSFQIRESDYKKKVMCGVDNAQYNSVVIANSKYSPSIIKDMIQKHKDGAEIVCVRKKRSKIKKIFASIALAYYNLILRVSGEELFSMGICNDLQLISGETLNLMKERQPYSHRIRTMYAPNVYQTEYLEYDFKSEKIKYSSPKSVFCLSIVMSILFFIALIGGLIMCALLNANFIIYFLAIFGFLLLEFISSSLVVNSIARVQIGPLLDANSNGKIYEIERIN